MDDKARRWSIVVAAALPGLALAAFCLVAAHESWLIATHQIAVIPKPVPGMTSAPEVPAARLLPLILGSGALAGVFAYAALKPSKKALLYGYLALALVAGIPYALRLL